MTKNHDERPMVYTAGPFTYPNPTLNTHNTCRFATSIMQSGIITPVIPHLTLLWDCVTPLSYDEWLSYDLALLARCDAMFRLPGESPGADAEVQYCKEKDIPVFYEIEELYAWANDWTKVVEADVYDSIGYDESKFPEG